MKLTSVATSVLFLTPGARSHPFAEPNTPANELLPPTKTIAARVSTPTPTQAGMVSGCTKFHQVTASTTWNCNTIASKYGISLATFIRWNPAVGSDCRRLVLDNWYCVARA